MNTVQRIFRADATRLSRFHDGKDRLHISADMPRALWTTAARHMLGIYPRLPWLTYSAIARLRPLVKDRRVLEFGAGSSTEWFSRYASEVISLENDPEWYNRAKHSLGDRRNVTLKLLSSPDAFMNALEQFSAFDVYLIDCQAPTSYGVATEDLRISCLRAAAKHAKESSVFVIDNTDVNRVLDDEITRLFPDRAVQRFAGWVPGIFHPNETTIVL